MKQNYKSILQLAKSYYSIELGKNISYSKKGFIEIDYTKKIIRRIKKIIKNKEFLINLLSLIDRLLTNGKVISLNDYISIISKDGSFDFELIVNKDRIYYKYKYLNNGLAENISSEYINNKDYIVIRKNDKHFDEVLLLDSQGIEQFQYRKGVVNKDNLTNRKRKNNYTKEKIEETKYRISDDKVLKTYKKEICYLNKKNIAECEQYLLGDIYSNVESLNNSINFYEFDKDLFIKYINNQCDLDSILEDIYKRKIKKI